MLNLRQRLSDWVPIRRGEGLVTGLMFLYIFGALTAYYILKPLRSGLFLTNLPSSDLVYAYWLSALFAGTLAAPIFRIGHRVSAIALITLTNVMIIGTLVFFSWAMGRDISILPYVYYVYVQVAPVLVVAQFWLLAGYMYDNRQAKRIFGFLGAGASAGALAGSFLVRVLRTPMGVRNLLLLCVAICFGLILLSLAAWRYRLKGVSAASAPKRFGGETDKFPDLVRLVFGSSHLSRMATFILLTMITSQLADWQINDAVQRAFAGISKAQQHASIDEFFAAFNFYANIVGIALQLAATSVVVRRFGIWAATLFLPSAVFVTSLGVLAAPMLLTTLLVEGSDSVFRYSLNRAGLELLYMPLSPDVRKKIKLFIDVFIDRVGRAIAGVIILGVTSHYLPLGLRGSSVAILCLTAAAIIICLQLRNSYVAAFREQLSRKELDLSEVNRFVTDPASVRLLLNALESSQERQILYALRLLQSSSGIDYSGRLLPLLDHPSEHVREEALHGLCALRRDLGEPVRRMLDDPSGKVRRAAVDYLCSHNLGDVSSLLSDRRIDIRLAAADWIADHDVPGLKPSSDSVRRMLSMTGPESQSARITAAKLALRLPRAESVRVLRPLLADPDIEVRRTALRSAGVGGLPDLIFEVSDALTDRDVRPAAREALLMYGPRFTGTLGDILADPGRDLALRREIPWVLGRIPSKRSAEVLLDQLQIKDPLLKYRVVKALNRLHAHSPDLPAPNPAIAGHIYSQTRAYYEALVLWQAFDPDGRTDRHPLIVRALKERLDQNLEIIFRLLGLQYPQDDIHSAYEALRSNRADRRASALEFLDNLLQQNLKTIILPLVEEPSAERLISRATSLFGIREVSREQALQLILSQPDVWLKACAVHEIGRECLSEMMGVCRKLSLSGEPLVRETAEWALGRCG